MISVVFLKNLYYSTFLLPKTILISGLFVTFVYGYKSLIYNGKKKEIIGSGISTPRCSLPSDSLPRRTSFADRLPSSAHWR